MKKKLLFPTLTLFLLACATLTSPFTTPTPQSEYGCDASVLTPEELVNCGPHEYSMKSTITGGGCNVGDVRTDTLTSTIVFKDDAISFSPDSVLCRKTALNTYTCKDGKSTIVVVFNASGYAYDSLFLEEYDCAHTDLNKLGDSCGCNSYNDFSILK